LNSAVGTISHDKKEERLEELIAELSQYPKTLGDYREKLKQKGIDREISSYGNCRGNDVTVK
jgi:DNA-binding protein H-NS